jgi:hypothetical protein
MIPSSDLIKMPETAKEVAETLQDGCQIQVQHLDGSTEWIKVRRIPRNEFVQYAQTLATVADETDECAFLAGKTAEWINTLTDDSFEAVMQEGRRLNFSRFEPWWHRQVAKLNLAKIDAPAIKAAVERALRKT